MEAARKFKEVGEKRVAFNVTPRTELIDASTLDEFNRKVKMLQREDEGIGPIVAVVCIIDIDLLEP
jgi:hypothetical protein